jgi:hypothetical protein
VLNEVDHEHATTPEDYTKRYDWIVDGIRKVSPQTKFVGMALGSPGAKLSFFKYFLNGENHTPGIPLDFISFHFYSMPALDETLDCWQHTFFNQADGFLATTKDILAIRDRLSPSTKIDIDELGVILPTDHIPHRYWNAASALYAYLFVELVKLGVDVIGESQLVGYPSQFPSVSMMNYNTGKPNARFWVLKLLKDNFHPGDKLLANNINSPQVEIQGFVTPEGRKVLIVNKTNTEKTLKLQAELQNSSTLTIDEDTGDEGPRPARVSGPELKLAPFAVTVLRLQ